jgi:myosin heavy subunit
MDHSADYADMVQMPRLTEELINSNIFKRFQRQCVYTNVSNILIAVKLTFAPI